MGRRPRPADSLRTYPLDRTVSYPWILAAVARSRCMDNGEWAHHRGQGRGQGHFTLVELAAEQGPRST